jgi:hypothetical protein
VALDSGNKIFATSFKLISAPDDLALAFDLSLTVNQASSVGLLHCNNMNSGSLYGPFADGMRRYNRDYYSGECVRRNACAFCCSCLSSFE